MKVGKLLIVELVLLGGLLVFNNGCESSGQTGALLGGLTGAGIGQIAGRDTESTLIGAAIGSTAGYIIGNEQDKKEYRAQVEGLRQEMNVVSVNITNTNGSISEVLMRKEGIGYRGPRGEFYDHLPSEAELEPIYGF